MGSGATRNMDAGLPTNADKSTHVHFHGDLMVLDNGSKSRRHVSVLG